MSSPSGVGGSSGRKALEWVTQFRRKFPSQTSTSSSSSLPIAPNSGFKGRAPIEGMEGWLECLGYNTKIINGLNVIHVAGTKGKGSTCAYVDSLLRANARRKGVNLKVGMYTSPWLWPQNRIRINSEPISEELFLERGYEVERKLSLYNPSPGIIPGVLQIIALIAFHTFIRAEVNVVICEVHHGGEFDATNFIERPVITAITKIDIDHVENLGGCLEHIAWHKSGIFKKNVPAFSVQQAPAAENTLRARAEEKNAPLQFVKAATQATTLKSIPLEQQENCALAIEIVRGFLERNGGSLENQDIKAGVESFYLPGRYEIINSRGCTWYVDGAHNETSLEEAAKWYKRVADASATRVLIFANFSDKRTREWTKLLDKLGHCLESLQMSAHHVIFVREIEHDKHFSITEEQLDNYAVHWEKGWPSSIVHKVNSVGEGLDKAKGISAGAQILVTGSLYLAEAADIILKDEST